MVKHYTVLASRFCVCLRISSCLCVTSHLVCELVIGMVFIGEKKFEGTIFSYWGEGRQEWGRLSKFNCEISIFLI